MSKPREPTILTTAFADYTLADQLGEGGAGRVFAATDGAGAPVAIKILTNATNDKRKRFKNEIAFLARTKHTNIVSILDHGNSSNPSLPGPFYVMQRYTGSLRNLLNRKLEPADAMKKFQQILDGVEAAHLLGATHRDLKPENVLYSGPDLAIADFGIARFTEQELITLVETGHEQRLANFQYAAPEQRAPGMAVGVAADIYALGLILNEMFTGKVPHGTDYLTIKSVSDSYCYLDPIIAQMIKQNPVERPTTALAPVCETGSPIFKVELGTLVEQRLHA